MGQCRRRVSASPRLVRLYPAAVPCDAPSVDETGAIDLAGGSARPALPPASRPSGCRRGSPRSRSAPPVAIAWSPTGTDGRLSSSSTLYSSPKIAASAASATVTIRPIGPRADALAARRRSATSGRRRSRRVQYASMSTTIRAMPPPSVTSSAAFVTSDSVRPIAAPAATSRRGEQRRDAERHEPAEEAGAPVDAAELVALAGARRGQRGRRGGGAVAGSMSVRSVSGRSATSSRGRSAVATAPVVAGVRLVSLEPFQHPTHPPSRCENGVPRRTLRQTPPGRAFTGLCLSVTRMTACLR